MSDVRLVTTDAALEALARELEHADAIALDVEADGLFAYRAKLCVLQVAWRNGESPGLAIIDPFLVHVELLRATLSADGPVKVLHDLTFDARMLSEAGIALGHVRDTSVAARFLGEQATGLARMVESRLAVTLSKDLQDHNWSKRPLGPREVEYLSADVRHLLALDDILAGEVAAREIEAEVALECAYKLGTALRPPKDDRPLHTRIKGAADIDPVARAVLRRLVEARERLAETEDVPPFRIVRNELLLELARRKPKNEPDLRRALGRDRAVRHLEAWQKAIALGVADEPEPKPRMPAPPPDLAERRALDRTLSTWRRERAEERGVDPQVIVPGHCTEPVVEALLEHARAGTDLSRMLLQVEGFGAFRVERYLDGLRALVTTTG